MKAQHHFHNKHEQTPTFNNLDFEEDVSYSKENITSFESDEIYYEQPLTEKLRKYSTSKMVLRTEKTLKAQKLKNTARPSNLSCKQTFNTNTEALRSRNSIKFEEETPDLRCIAYFEINKLEELNSSPMILDKKTQSKVPNEILDREATQTPDFSFPEIRYQNPLNDFTFENY